MNKTVLLEKYRFSPTRDEAYFNPEIMQVERQFSPVIKDQESSSSNKLLDFEPHFNPGEEKNW